MNWILLIIVVLTALGCFFAGLFLGRVIERNQPEPDEVDRMGLPSCKPGCDVNECEIWCTAKERFMRYPPND